MSFALHEELMIYELKRKYPQLISSNSINTALLEVTSLQLFDCSNCSQLPQLGQLPQLKYLRIKAAIAIVSIGAEILSNGKLAGSAFPNLSTYIILGHD
ncbi:RNI-like protein [Dioscorea alata]|uniref:RNI-like protein n=1 Tax=Dioscorea alata TaxID=55571 RepID=A0ACB7UIC8_DIOAL|nr:RNI-like protein [Dioscorea alata]